MVKTAIENKQNLIVEGCYIPMDWQKDFFEEYLKDISFYCLIMSETYIRNHFADIKGFASVIEDRLDDEYCTMDSVLEDNASFLKRATAEGVEYFLIDESYKLPL